MARQQKRKIEFDLDQAKAFFPGAFDILKVTRDLLQMRVDTQNIPYVLGTVACHAIILGHTIELLLKTRIQAEGGEIEPTHNLYTLFISLEKGELLTRLEELYKVLESVKIWDAEKRYGSIQSLLKSHSEIHVDWRYVMENKGQQDFPIECLSLAAEWIYNILVKEIS